MYLPIIHVNIFASICPDCLNKLIRNDFPDSKEEQLHRLFNLYDFVGRIPPQDYSSLYYIFKDRNNIIALTQHLCRLWSPDIFKNHFGSFFAALVKSGILPRGTRRMKLGTMILANDGHVCLSLVEKDIDDFLYSLKICHKKEVLYPDSNYRTDWEITWKQKRYFIEYFGLMNIRKYAKKAEQKAILAAANNIELISIYPDTDWKELLIKTLRPRL